MEWWKQHCAFLDSEEFLGCEPVDQASWLKLMRYCIGQENGGVIPDCGDWGDRRWQQVVRITLKESRRPCPLWRWEGGTLIVAAYPTEDQEGVQRARVTGVDGGRASSPAKSAAARANGALGGRPKKTQQETQQEPNNPSQNPREESRVEKSRGEETERAPDEHDICEPAAATPPAADADRWGYVRAEAWAKNLLAVNCKIGTGSWPAWKTLCDRWGVLRVVEIASTVPATERFADKVEVALGEGAQAKPAPFAGDITAQVLQLPQRRRE